MRPDVNTILVVLMAGLAGGCAPRASQSLPDTAAQIRAAHALAKQAQTADQDGDEDRAIDLYRQALGAYNDFPAAWNNLGVLLLDRDENMAAVEAFRAAADQSPTDPRPLTNIGVIWQRLGYLDKAAEAYTEALERDGSHLPALRESVVIDVIRGTISDRTSQRAQRALLIEKDPNWSLELQRRKLIIDQALASGPDSLGR